MSCTSYLSCIDADIAKISNKIDNINDRLVIIEQLLKHLLNKDNNDDKDLTLDITRK